MKSVSLVSLKDQAAAALRREIYAGELPDGAELRQEDIAAQLGISRLPVREAMQQLQNEGLLERPAQPPCAGGGGDRRASAAELCPCWRLWSASCSRWQTPPCGKRGCPTRRAMRSSIWQPPRCWTIQRCISAFSPSGKDCWTPRRRWGRLNPPH